MSTVLQELVGERKAHAAKGDPKKRATVRNMLRLVAIAVIAVAVYRYHGQLFAAAQPLVNRFYQLLRK
jgi:hypothetical protein